MSLKEKYNKICNKYLDQFSKQTGIPNEGWVGNEPGGVAYVLDYFFGFKEIMVTVDNNIPFDTLVEWYEKELDFYSKNYSPIKGFPSLEIYVRLNYGQL